MNYKAEKIRQLILRLNEASKAYYNGTAELMTDFEYDKEYDELLNLEKETGIVYPDSPTQNVGYRVVSSLRKVKHPSKMLSLDKTKETDKLVSFLEDKEGILSYKMDGLTIVLHYENGKLSQAVTRGNGEIGEDITHNAEVFKNIPLKINTAENITVRGEAVIYFSDFEKINEHLNDEDKYKNPRNLCSGTVRQLDSKVVAERNVNFYAFALVEGGNAKLRSEQFEWLKDLGFTTVEYKLVNAQNIKDAVKGFETEIPSKEYATDGLVLSFNDTEYGKNLGTTAKFPKDSIAFKWQDETAETTLREIEWNTSRTGLINPVAVFDSVELEGTTVNRASLHNVSIIENLKLKVGDRITVFKANMIIPQIAENLTESGADEPPRECPVCGESTEIISLRDGKALKCPNPNCHARLVFGIVHYASRDAMNIEGFSEATTERFIEKGFIENYTDLYSLEKHEDEIVNMEGFGKTSFKKLTAAINDSKHRPFANFIYALGIDNVGSVTARIISEHFGYDMEKLIHADRDELCVVDGVGEVTANSVVKYFRNEKNAQLLKKALDIIQLEIPEKNDTIAKLDGLTFVVTGDVHIFKNRKELQNEIIRFGGKATGTVSSKTSYLINNDVNSSSSKNKKAKELGIPIITEEEFVKLTEEK